MPSEDNDIFMASLKKLVAAWRADARDHLATSQSEMTDDPDAARIRIVSAGMAQGHFKCIAQLEDLIERANAVKRDT